MYTFTYVDDAGATQRLDLPLTIADWAATEGRFRQHFTVIPASAWNEDMVPFHEFIDFSSGDREGKTPFIYTKGESGKLARLAVSPEIVRLAEERLQFWAQLKELAGLEPSAAVRERIVGDLTTEYEAKLAAVRAGYEAKLADMQATYPRAIARRLAETLIRGGAGKSLTELLTTTERHPDDRSDEGSAFDRNPEQARARTTRPTPDETAPPGAAATSRSVAALEMTKSEAAVVASPASPVATTDDDLTMEPYIDSARCTSCNECINLNGKLFGYNASKQAAIKDPKAGTFQQLVLAAERCPVGIIHPGTPLNPKEKDLEKWIKRAQPFS
jgi:pyruvate-ferredoxin/flavodoxin oxidoreductase